MTVVFHSCPIESRRGPGRRLALALAISALLHLCLARSVIVEGMPSGGARSASAPIQVHLETAAPPLLPEPPLPLLVSRSSGIAAVARPIEPAKDDVSGKETAAIELRQPPDPVYYPARDLDSYPRPVAPLKLVVAPDGMSGKAQLILQINEHGTVDRVSVVETEPRGHLEDELRALLLQTQFLPALKDGRPVKSRILLSISLE